ncbi:MAG: site-specific integrase [Bacteroidota bacterium]|nr:site-specific integrase [Bacteroidota bacterium]
MKAAFELSSKENRNGLFEIYIRIQDGAKKKRIKANIAVEKKQFKSKNHNMKWVVNHPNSHKLNSDLKALIEEYEDLLFNGSVEKKILTPETVIHSANKGSISNSLVKYWELKISQMLEYNQRKGYSSGLNNWNSYTTKEKLGDLDFKQISFTILKGFENFLYKKELTSSSVYSNLKRIRALFNSAIKEGILNPGDYIFKSYTMPRAAKAKKERLDIEELKAFAEQEYTDGSLIKTVQQAFLLSFNMAGVRIEDVLTLKWSYVKNERIEYQMIKTDSWNSFKLTPQIKKILEYFKSISTGSIYIVPILEDGVEKLENEFYKKEISRKTALVNKYLKKIAKDAEIDKKVSSHIARHTFASIAIKKSNGDVNFLQNALKHSSLTITQGYLLDLDIDSLDEKMGDVTNI